MSGNMYYFDMEDDLNIVPVFSVEVEANEDGVFLDKLFLRVNGVDMAITGILKDQIFQAMESEIKIKVALILQDEVDDDKIARHESAMEEKKLINGGYL